MQIMYRTLLGQWVTLPQSYGDRVAAEAMCARLRHLLRLHADDIQLVHSTLPAQG